MKKLLYIVPHLSTGGLPQFLLKKIELLRNIYDIYVIEYNDYGKYDIQKKQIQSLVSSENFYTLSEDKFNIINHINNIKPNIIHFEEIPEIFMDDKISNSIYNINRHYNIFETTHTSTFNINNKKYFPDKFIFVSLYNALLYNKFDIPIEIVEYPIDKQIEINDDNKKELMLSLGMDSEYTNIIIVGLFVSHKNQSYIFELASKLIDENIIFHFIGNLSENFKSYWGNLMENKPTNCIIWGELDNIDDYLKVGDIFLFASTMELNPLVIKESMEYNISKIINPLPIYFGKYNNTSIYINGNIEHDIQIIKNEHIKKVINTNNILNIVHNGELNTIIKNFNYTNIDINDIVLSDDMIYNSSNGSVDDYKLYLSYRKEIEKSIIKYDYTILINGELTNDTVNNIFDNILIMTETKKNYLIQKNIIILTKTISNIILQKYKTLEWMNLYDILSHMLEDYDSDYDINISYSEPKNRIYMNLLSKKSQSNKFYVKFKDIYNNILYDDNIVISSDYNTWSQFNDLREIDTIFIEYYINNIKVYTKKLEK